MTNPLPIVLVSSLLAGGVGAVAGSTILSPAPTAAETNTAVGADLSSELKDLQAQNRELSNRLKTLEDRESLAPLASPGRVAADGANLNLEEAVRGVLEEMNGDGTGLVAATPSMQAAVESVLEMREQRERQERDQRRAEAEEKRIEDRLAKMQTELGLDQNQTNSMRGIFQDQDLKQNELRDQMRAGRENGTMDFADMRTMWGDLRAETNTAIEGVLTPVQYEQYQESFANDRGGRGGNDGGGGGGRGGNDGGGGGRRGR